MKSALAFAFAFAFASHALAQVAVDQSAYRDDCRVRIARVGDRLVVEWPISNDDARYILLDVSGTKPLIEQIGTRRGNDREPILSAVDPAYFLTVGTREMPPGKPPEQKWQVFFDNPHRRPHEVHASSLKVEHVRIAG